MISIDHVPDDEPPLDTSPLFRGVLKTAAYIDANGGIGLTKCGAFQPQFVRWAAASFDSPGYSEEELFKLNKVLDEIDFPPVGDIHAPLAGLRLARRRKGMFLLTKAGRDLRCLSRAAAVGAGAQLFLLARPSGALRRARHRGASVRRHRLDLLHHGTSPALVGRSASDRPSRPDEHGPAVLLGVLCTDASLRFIGSAAVRAADTRRRLVER